jgi:hypothetical protein
MSAKEDRFGLYREEGTADGPSVSDDSYLCHVDGSRWLVHSNQITTAQPP